MVILKFPPSGTNRFHSPPFFELLHFVQEQNRMTISNKYPDYTCTFVDVYLAELDYVKKRRETMNLTYETVANEQQRVQQELEQLRIQKGSEDSEDQKHCNLQTERTDAKLSPEAGLIGLAISGGGIRSATFNLGLFQAFDKNGVLRYCDYMSTVSGGGYIGSCLSSLLTDSKATTDSNVPPEQGNFPFRFLRDSESDEKREVNYELTTENNSYDERREVSYLRAAKNYLGLNSNLLNLDTWRAIATFLSGIVMINIVPFALTLIIAYFLFLFESPIAQYTCVKANNEIVQLIKDDENLKTQLIKGTTINELLNEEIQFVEMKQVQENLPLLDALATQSVKFKLCSYKEIKKSSEYQKIAFSTDKSEEKLHFFIKNMFQFAFMVFLGMVMIRGIAVLANLNNRFMTGLQASFLVLTVLSFLVAGLIAFTFYIFANAANVDQNLGQLLNYTLLTAIVFVFLGRLKSEHKILQFLFKLMLYLSFIMIIPIIFAQFLHWLWETNFLRAEVAQFVAIPFIGSWSAPVVLVIVLFLISLFININNISLHAFYRDGLRSTYLIKRDKDGRIKSNGKLKLTELHQHYNGPYHLINTTLNIMGSKNRHLKGRGADYFIFSKLYCGCESTGYRNTSAYNHGKTELATAMAISGAAASPKMGMHTNPLLGLYMILFNIRLNVWMPNPNPQYEKPPLWPYYFIKEFFPLSKEQDSLLNLSDGGHHENLGIYPLLKRRCKLIIASDSGADPESLMNDIANLQRKARIDFGINIELDLTPLRPNQHRFVEQNWVKGIIHYPNDTNGVLIFIKTSMTGKEPEDLLAYRRQSTDFPDETTANQFFQEDQFESYRKLGEVIGKTVSTEIEQEVEKLFGNLDKN